MLGEIVRFEWRYQTRQVSFTAAVLLYFFAGFTLAATGFGPDNVNVNSPYAIAESTGLLSLLSVFVLAAFCANAVIRDREYRMEELIFTTTVSKLDFLLGRFGGSFLAAFTAFSTGAVGMMLGRFVPGHDPARLGAFNPTDYVAAFGVIALPNVLFAAVLLFAVATVTRSLLASYAAAVFLYVLYFAGAALTNSPLMAASAPGAAASPLASLLDPFALSAFFEQTAQWPADTRNTRMVALTGNFLINRIVWLCASGVLLALVYRLFAFRVSAERSRRPAPEPNAASIAPPTTQREVSMGRNPWQVLLSSLRLEIRGALANLPFAALVLLWFGLAASEIVADITGGELGSSFYATTARIEATIRQPLAMLGMILVTYYSAEIVWRDRVLRVAPSVNATPAPSAAFVLAKWLALSALVAVLTTAAFLVGAGVQIASGYPLEPSLLLSFALVNALPLLVFAAIAVLIQTLSPHKYLGMILVVVVGLIAQQGAIAGLEHPLVRIASAPDMQWSAFNGFGHYATPWRWLMTYWSAFAALALVVASAAWRHERGQIRAIPAAFFTLLFLAAGAIVFFNTNVVNGYETSEDVLAWKAAYEKQYATMATLPRPRVREVKAAIDLEPEERRYRVRGNYLLVNETRTPIRTIVVGIRRDAGVSRIALESEARVEHDTRFNHHVFHLANPLQPGAGTRLQFDVSYENPGFPANGSDPAIVANGAYIMSFRSLPSIGYRESYEIENERERRRHGLAGPASRNRESSELATGDWTRFDVTVSTAADQTVVAPGNLIRSWHEGSRRYFHYRSQTPIPNQFAIASARYALARRRHDGVDVEVYYHPSHGANVAKILDAAAASLRLFSERFGQYPHRHLRIAEVPVYWNFGGFAQPGVIFLQEERAFLLDGRDGNHFDLLYRRVAHEVAHQWWGHSLVAADAPGATMLTESLAKYSELLALEQGRGRTQARRSLSADHDLYLINRTAEAGTEPPLARSEDQAYLYYRKGAIVMNALRDLLGEHAVDETLRNLLNEEGGPVGSPTTADLLAQLNQRATAEQRILIDEWMNDVVFYDFKLIDAKSRSLPNGRVEVSLMIEASKEGGTPLDESISIGLFEDDHETLVHLARPRLRPGANKVSLIVDRLPAVAMIDPYITRIEHSKLDNTLEVK